MRWATVLYGDARIEQGGRVNAPEIVEPGSPEAKQVGAPSELLREVARVAWFGAIEILATPRRRRKDQGPHRQADQAEIDVGPIRDPCHDPLMPLGLRLQGFDCGIVERDGPQPALRFRWLEPNFFVSPMPARSGGSFFWIEVGPAKRQQLVAPDTRRCINGDRECQRTVRSTPFTLRLDESKFTCPSSRNDLCSEGPIDEPRRHGAVSASRSGRLDRKSAV